jgi:hypothetical protein
LRKYDFIRQIIEFTYITDSDLRRNEITNSIFIDPMIISQLKEMIEDEESEEQKLNYIDHLELLVEYQSKGISALDYFVSFSQIEFSFADFCYGFNSFDERKRYLISKPFLMESKSIKCINRFIEREKNIPASAVIQQRLYRNLLKACRVIGIEEAFEEYKTPAEKYVNVTNILFKAKSLYELVSISANYKDIIYSKYIRNFFHYLQAKYEKDQLMRDSIITIWNYISRYQPIERSIWFWE